MEQSERLLQLALRAQKRDIRVFTRFLDLNGQKEVRIAAKKADVNVKLFGGASGETADECSERKMACFFLTDEPEEFDFPLDCLLAAPRSQRFSTGFSHRDVLGSLMSLGIEREYIGDIIVKKEGAYILCERKQTRFIKQSLFQIGGSDIDCDNASLPSGKLRETKQIVLQVASPRADAVIAKLFSISRDDTRKLISSGKILIDDAPLMKPEKELLEDQVISVRGYGRARYQGLKSISKKGKQNVTVLLYT